MSEFEKNKSLKISGEATYRVQGSLMPPVSVMVRQISGTGVKIITTESLSADVPLELMIKVTSDSDPISAIGKVTWQGHVSSKFLMDTTIEFTQISSKDQSRLINFIIHSAESIKVNRHHVRCPLLTEVIYSRFSDPNEEKKGESGDIGVEGMKLFVKEEIDVTTDLKLSFDLTKGRGRVVAEGTVVWKGQQAQGITVIGVKFIDIKDRDKKRILRYINYTLSQHSE